MCIKIKLFFYLAVKTQTWFLAEALGSITGTIPKDHDLETIFKLKKKNDFQKNIRSLKVGRLGCPRPSNFARNANKFQFHKEKYIKKFLKPKTLGHFLKTLSFIKIQNKK